MTCKSACLPHSNIMDPQALPGEMRSFFRRITCECATCPRYDDAPMARELFCRIEGQGQSPREAAKALGLGSRDCTYLLSGFRRELALGIVTLLLADTLPRPEHEED